LLPAIWRYDSHISIWKVKCLKRKTVSRRAAVCACP
jgi:hypothetical protein